ncbi:GNAT family N-acetyltransferase [Campylobacter coli]|nr:GNAT family N-acetyltransferase [Campylobacter coli]AHK74723.1 acetyltransferase [Campylobacter coli RM5611]ALL29844.1 acetyltransferase [Campylobacter coli]ALL31335.1 acetyltransferase [Campylobacter coli]ALL33221.1 acetyltransferase [Campylobacter coli]EAB5287621.1 GNAT family N-acetyltransferase [Campylobacter coli]
MFKKAFYKGFKLSNYYDNFGTIEEKILKQEFILQKYKNNNFFFFNRTDGLLYYFINDLQDYDLKACYIKILSKAPKHALHDEFLKLNHFKKILNHKQMVLNKEIKPSKFCFISKALHEDSKELYSFFRKYFDPYLFYFSQKNLEEKIPNILVYKENQKIRAALIYTQTLNANFLDFIAVDRNLKHKNVAFALLNHYFAANTQNKFFKLFVEEKNQKAINFYKRAGFCFNHINLKFYRNF